MRVLYLRYVFTVCLALGAWLPTWAQPGVDPLSTGLSGAALRANLKANWYDGRTSVLSYSSARQRMYSSIDVRGGKITCVYTGYQRPSSSSSNADPINCEHTVPQSFFSSASPMVSDIHHLFPTYSSANSARSNYAFDEFTDGQTRTYYYVVNNTYTASTTLPSGFDAAQASKISTSTRWEPREEHKGDLARCIFYFYTMYPTQAGTLDRVADPDVLYQWHLQDPVSDVERDRNNGIEDAQGNRNPYVDFPDAVLQAWNDAIIINPTTPTIATSVPKLSFTPGEALEVSYTITGNFAGANTFTAQLSQPDGSFATSTTIGTRVAGTGGTIACTIPAGAASGTSYKIRVIANNPFTVGTENAGAITIGAAVPAAITIGTVPGGTFEQGASFAVPFTVTGTFNAGNTFYAELSSASGSFASGGTQVGSRTGTGGGDIVVTLPTTTTPSNSYRLRITSSNPGIAETAGTSVQTGTFTVTAFTPPTLTVTGVDAAAPYQPGDAIEVAFDLTGNYAAGNVFTAQLSDAAGSFASPAVLGTLSGTVGATVVGTVPAATPAGTGYQVRVVSSSPVVTSAGFPAAAPFVAIEVAPAPVITLEPFGGTYNAGDGGSLTYTVGGTGSFAASNQFTVQLSDANGSFVGAQTISTPVTGTTGGNLSFTIPATALGGTNYRIRVAGSNPATVSQDNGAPLTVIANTSAQLPVVINKYQNNGSSDVVELLVIQNNLDLRGYILKDFSASMVNDNGGRHEFSANALWSSLPAGALVIVRAGSTAAADVTLNPATSDWTVDVGLDNTTYFTDLGGTFDIAGTEIVMLKSPGSGATGTTGNVHSIAAGNPSGGVNYLQAIEGGSVLRSTTGGTTTVYATSPASLISEFIGSASATGTASFGAGNNTTNQTLIDNLRASQTAPFITTLSPGFGLVGEVVTLSGGNFSATLANNVVRFGATVATVQSATANQLTVLVPDVPPATYSVTVDVTGSPLTAQAPIGFAVTVATPNDAPGLPLGLAVRSYPNPVREVLQLEVDMARPAAVAVEVLSTQGAVVARFAYPATLALREALNLSTLPSGVYLVRLQAGGEGTHWRVVKQ